MIDSERDAFGTSYPAHGMLMCFEDGRRLHPDTVTSNSTVSSIRLGSGASGCMTYATPTPPSPVI
jgi:hypothetical protein